MAITLSELQALVGDKLVQEGTALFQSGKVSELTSSSNQVIYLVNDRQPCRVLFSAEGRAGCSCPQCFRERKCPHLIAAGLAAQQSGVLDRLQHTAAAMVAPSLLATMDSALPQEGGVRMEITLRVSRSSYGSLSHSIGLRIGEDRLYVVKSIPQLLIDIDHRSSIAFGKGFTFQPEWMRFDQVGNQVLDLLRTLCSAYEARNALLSYSLSATSQRMLPLPEPFVEQLLHLLQVGSFKLEIDGRKTLSISHVSQGRVQLGFRVTGDLRGVTITGSMPKELFPLTSTCSYVTLGDNVLEVPPEQRQVILALWNAHDVSHGSFSYTMRETPRVVGELIPFLKVCSLVEIDDTLQRMLEKVPLQARVYLDIEGRDVVARTEFLYGSRIIDPFNEAPPPETLERGQKLLLRDALAERKVLDVLGSAGFHVSKGRIYLSGQEAIFQFMTEGIHTLEEHCEVFLSQDFRRISPRRPMLQGRMTLRNGRIELNLSDGGQPTEELLGIMEALARRRQYFRLKDGSFLDLSDMEQWQATAAAVTEAAAIEGAERLKDADMVSLSASRLYYLSNLLEMAQLPIEEDEEIHRAVHALSEANEDTVQLPLGLSLRPYQARGFHWLRTLDRLHMGGVLADDMGLGKTVEVIALLKSLQAEKRISLVVAPTSLVYNWLSELDRFAPELSAMVLTGTSAQRASQIEHVKQAGDVDVLITSYPLIRRDAELMRDIPFRVAVLDEAQQIKNAFSVGAAAVKQLKADTRFALTGTPMENSAGELWSIFDFVLPGYLNTYAAFVRRYQDGRETEDLRRRIRPFLLRRLKNEVLTELPDKNETLLTAQMTTEQQKVYQASLERLRQRVNRVMDEKGLNRGRIEVLSCMTELRQICCHPALVLDGYQGSSGKLELLLEMLPTALSQGRRILIFSQFTRMLKLLQRQLENISITCLYLDGETPSQTRMDMAEQFNNGFGQVFLISLKAGGTGLNLTGADMVIHYDPWWNPAAEDQATDRAHRIGQTRKVDVIRLVTHATIEEQVVTLGQRKRALFDQLITPGEELVTALTESDIRALFA